ncbi:hypothetical protein ACN4DU_06570 [Corynebacterium macclintockiae]|uniref:hypothetical protein n=1 Tax=Corynebacterium macclintockiae TaxID=2913501 RepID=UPI003EBA6477
MNNTLNAMGWVRLVVYVISALVGTAAVVANTLGHGDIAGLLGTLAGAGAAVTGGTAVANIQRAPDQKPTPAGVPAGFDVRSAATTVSTIVEALAAYQSRAVFDPQHISSSNAPAPEFDNTVDVDAGEECGEDTEGEAEQADDGTYPGLGG